MVFMQRSYEGTNKSFLFIKIISAQKLSGFQNKDYEHENIVALN